MAGSDLTLLRSPDFPQVLKSAIDHAVDRMIVRAIVHLNFNEPEQARDVLLDALTEINFRAGKESNSGNPTR